MHVLVISLSGMKGALSTLPALHDAYSAVKKIKFDWLISDQYSDIPELFPHIKRVITVNTSNISVSFAKGLVTGEFNQLKKQLRHTHYDLIIDAQGNELSALLTRVAKGPSCGYDKQSLQNGLLSVSYDRMQFVAKTQHIVDRIRQLFAQSLNYSLIDKTLNYGIEEFNSTKNGKTIKKQKEMLFFTGTNWKSKRWPTKNWVELANLITNKGFKVVIPWELEADHKVALTIKRKCKMGESIEIIEPNSMKALTHHLARAMLVVSIDSSLAHLASAMEVPLINLYGPSHPILQGTPEKNANNLMVQYHCSPCEKPTCRYEKHNDFSPCYDNLPASYVFKKLSQLLKKHYKRSSDSKSSKSRNSVMSPIQKTRSIAKKTSQRHKQIA